jgi:hypothetical protein
MFRFAVLALWLFSGHVSAQTGADDPWKKLVGLWRGGGEVSGMSASIELRFRPAFGGRGYHLSFDNRMRGKDDQVWPFAAEALYLCDAQGACRGHWYDSRGMVLPLEATAAGDRLVVAWGDADTERGRTTYRLDGDGIAITDEVLGKDGAWNVFGETTASRSAP